MTAALTTFATERRDRYQALKQAVQNQFSTAGSEQDSAQSDYDGLVEDAADLDRAIDSLRQQLSAESNMPADIAALNDELRQRLIERAHLTAAIADARLALHNARAEADALQARLVELDSALSQAETGLSDANARERRHTAWSDGGLEDDIDTLRTIAGQLLDGSFTPAPEAQSNPLQTLNAARARVENDIPEVLRDLARARAVQADARLKAHRDLSDAITTSALSHQASVEGSSGLVLQRLAALETAEGNLKGYALGSSQNFDHALEVLQLVVGSAPLSAAASAAITAAALAADADAVTTEVALHSARRAVEDKALELKLAIVAARVGDIDADPDDDADVQTRRDELSDLQDALDSAETAHTAAFALAIDTWEAAVPDAIWHNLRAYDDAVALLTSLRDSDRAPLLTALTDAENALIAALAQDDDNYRLSQFLNFTRSLAREEADYLTRYRSALSISAMRGDF